jgi:Lon protease-like protein
MFPLGTVLFPYMPLPLRVFEERYLVMLSHILAVEPSEFGVVLIERGPEVGGGERRFAVGTVAQIAELDAEEEFVILVARGERRIEVVTWLEDDPYPKAEIRELRELAWDESLATLRDEAELAVRRALTVANEYTDGGWPADVELSDDLIASSWQLAAISPIGPIDQVALLRSSTTEELLNLLIEFAAGAEETFRALGPENEPDEP